MSRCINIVCCNGWFCVPLTFAIVYGTQFHSYMVHIAPPEIVLNQLKSAHESVSQRLWYLWGKRTWLLCTCSPTSRQPSLACRSNYPPFVRCTLSIHSTNIETMNMTSFNTTNHSGWRSGGISTYLNIWP